MRILLLILLATCCACLPALPPGDGQTPTDINSESFKTSVAELEIYLPYVGQGDATLLLTPKGKTLLIDAGPPEAGSEYLLPLLNRLNLRNLDAIVVSHYDLDHIGGIPSLVAGSDQIFGTEDDISIGVIYDRGGTPWDSSPGYEPYLKLIEQKAIVRHPVQVGESIDLDEDVSIQVMAVNASVWDHHTVESVDLSPSTYRQKENASSIALLIESGDFRYLTAGDLTGGGMVDGYLTPDVESLLGKAVGQVTALHVNHHGSLSSSNASFVAATLPKMVFIQAGKDNPYGHPRPEIVERWRRSGAMIHSIQKEGGFYLSIVDGIIETEQFP